MLKKADILSYYERFFENYPQKKYLSGIIGDLKQYDFDKKFAFDDAEQDYPGMLISKEYLYPEQIKEWDHIPEFLSIPELDELDKKYENKLMWRILDSSVTDAQILGYEKKWNIDLPADVKTFFKSYSNLLCEIECTYLENGESELVDLQLPLMLHHSEMSDFENDMYLEPVHLLSDLGCVLVAIKDDYEWWCLDCKSGKIVGFADDDDYSDIENPFDKEYLFSKHGKLLFNSFSDFLRTCFSID